VGRDDEIDVPIVKRQNFPKLAQNRAVCVSSVDENLIAVCRLYKYRVALSDVEKRNREFSALETGKRAVPHKRTQENKHQKSGELDISEWDRFLHNVTMIQQNPLRSKLPFDAAQGSLLRQRKKPAPF
jgi:hypothetical protein